MWRCRMIVNELLLGVTADPVKLEHVGEIAFDLVASAIAADTRFSAISCLAWTCVEWPGSPRWRRRQDPPTGTNRGALARAV